MQGSPRVLPQRGTAGRALQSPVGRNHKQHCPSPLAELGEVADLAGPLGIALILKVWALVYHLGRYGGFL